MLRRSSSIAILLLFLIGCASCTTAAPSTGSATATSFPTPPKTIWTDPALPESYLSAGRLPSDWQLVAQSSQASWIITPGGSQKVADWIYALVAPFPTVTDDVSLGLFRDLWLTGSGESGQIQHLLMDDDTYKVMLAILGEPAAGLVDIQPADQILDLCWQTTGLWAIIPFENLEARWKVISIDGLSPIHNDFEPGSYALTVNIGVTANPEFIPEGSSFPSGTLSELKFTNRDPEKLSVVVMTGVTAMVRATAAMMEQKGMFYPAEQIRDILNSADITHISNEIAFSRDCPEPYYMGEVLIFCSQPEYIQLLEYVGTDVVELTGDHLIDVPSSEILYTLEMYRDRGWGYYGGGANIEEAKQPLLLTDHSNRIAFIGCNAKPIGYARASETEPGAVHCDWKYLDDEIPLIRETGFLPIMTFSHIEYYSYSSLPQLQEDFHRAADDGAVIVSGSQGHQPQAIEFYNGTFLHYGLGNLFFDQYKEGEAQRQAFIDRHVFYDGRYINTELVTIIFVDYAQARLMTLEERSVLLTTVFNASGWNNINP